MNQRHDAVDVQGKNIFQFRNNFVCRFEMFTYADADDFFCSDAVRIWRKYLLLI